MVLTLGAGLPLCFLLSWYLLQLENEAERSDYAQRSQQIVTTINQGIQNDTDLLLSLRSFIDVMKEPTFAAFTQFVTPYFIRHPEIDAVIWAPVVDVDRREAFEIKATALFPHYAIHGQQANSHIYPVYYQQPDDQSLLGLDLGSNADILAAIQQAQDTNQIITYSGTIPAAFSYGPKGTFFQHTRVELFYPLYRSGTSFNTPSAWHDALSGISVLRINLKTLVDDSTTDVALHNLQVEIETEANTALGDRPELKAPSHEGLAILDRSLNLQLDKIHKIHYPLTIGNSTKTIVFTFIDNSIWPVKHKMVLFVLFASLTALALLGMSWMNMLLLERAKIEAEHAEDEVRQLNAELEQRVKDRTAELESFSYSVSHDLRVPLRAIDGFSRILLEDYYEKIDDEGKRLLNVVRDNTSRMAKLIDDILAFSRVGRKEVVSQKIDMGELVNTTIAELQPSLDGRNVKLEVGALTPAHGDAAMLRQVWVNLLSNAIKFTRSKAPAVISIGSYSDGTETFYYVKDNGAGFDMSYADKLFGVFQRLHSFAEFEGTGIGLAIVKRIITRHGGRVWAEGKTDEGATFYFTLPTIGADHA
ncbi:MAG: ATP-binding protein [Alphaproteobacteria bacterium]